MALSDKLREIRLAFEAGPTPDEDIRILDDHVEAMRLDGRIERAVRVGTKAPDFSLASTCGKTIALGELLPNGPIVLTWFRGNW